MVIVGSSFADFVRFLPHTFALTQQSLPPLWEVIILFVSPTIDDKTFAAVSICGVVIHILSDQKS